MRGKHFAVALTVVGVLATESAGQASAEVLALDCSGPGTTESIWIDIDKSAVTQNFPDGSLATEPAAITATSINWKHVNAIGTSTDQIDRTSGDFHYSIVSNSGQYFPGTHLQCVKGSTPFPATKL